MTIDHASTEASVICATCEERVPRAHTVLRSEGRRVCWFCHTDEPTGPDGEDWDDDEEWDDWDDDGWDD